MSSAQHLKVTPDHHFKENCQEVKLNASLHLCDLEKIAYQQCTVVVSDEVFYKVDQANVTLDAKIKNGDVIYGVNTGFGSFAGITISNADLQALQLNLLRSHACGVGGFAPVSVVRRMLALRINSLVRGNSGVSSSTIRTLLAILNANCLPRVPLQGSVGASGDLCPLAHLSLPLTGDGGQELFNPSTGNYEDAKEVMDQYHITPLSLQRKEGLALINGTQFITSVTCEALQTSINASRHGILAAAMSCEAMRAVTSAFDHRIHELRPHEGQLKTASMMCDLLLDSGEPSMLNKTQQGKVQDAYSIRCIPQIHGPFVEVAQLVTSILTTEINSVTDNPLIFPADNEVLSGGNFHGQYPAKAADMLALVIPDICNASERRVARMVDSHLSGLPAFLIPSDKGGLHSGMMIPQYVAAALCSEVKCLAHPSSVDTIPTCANQEDHVSMGAYAARKALQSATNAEIVVSIELLVAAQALDLLRTANGHAQSSSKVTRIHELVRSCVPFLETDRNLSADIDKVLALVRSGKLLAPFCNFPI